MLWFNYVASFSDGVQKVGVTSRPFHRLQSWLLEAARHGVRVLHFELSEPLANKAIAVQIKADIGRAFSAQSVRGHRSWFRYGPAEHEPSSEQEWGQLLEIPHVLRLAAETQNPVDFAFTAMQYYDFREFASELASNGELIRPATAVRLALTLVRPHEQMFRDSIAVSHRVKGLPEHDAQPLWDEYFEQKEALTNKRIKAVLA